MIVVDASVAVKWFIEEEGTDRALALRDQAMVAPDLIFAEVGNTLRTLTARGALTPVEAEDLFDLMATAPVDVWPMDDEITSQALKLALRLGHPIYDCIYLALSLKVGGPMVTADVKFVRRVEAERDLKHLVEPL